MRRVHWRLRVGCLAALLAVALLVEACGQRGDGLGAAFPAAEAVPGYRTLGDPRRFDAESLFQWVDGQAEAYFAYRFEEVAVRSYEGPSGAVVDVELWRVATPADAYGLFTAHRAGELLAVGNQGEGDPGRRLAFWQERAYVRIRARQDVPQADLLRLAEAVSAALPSGGERPALVARLPSKGLVEESVLFFHQELSIQDRLWLGGENRLGLSAQTDGVWAEYQRGAGEAPLQVIVIAYPDPASAAWGLEALQALGLPNLEAARAEGRLLAAAFGALDPGEAEAFLEALLAAQLEP